jgi:hypothetical protein
MRAIIFACLLLFCTSAQAQQRPLKYSVDCNYRPGQTELEVVRFGEVILLKLLAFEADFAVFHGPKLAESMTTYISYAYDSCKHLSRFLNKPMKIVAQNQEHEFSSRDVFPSVFLAVLNPAAPNNFDVRQNIASQRYQSRLDDAEHQRKFQTNRENEQRQIQNLASSLRARAVEDYKIQRFVSRKELMTNPFPFQGQVVGVGVAFIRMISATEALVGHCQFGPCSEPVVVKNFPNKALTGNEQMMLAAKVLGIRQLNSGEGSTPITELEFVGFVRCSMVDCHEYFRQ